MHITDMHITEEDRLAVKKGAYWLDQVYPEWLEAINLDYLNLQSEAHCVIGQVVSGPVIHPGYALMVEWLREVWPLDDIDIWMHEHGFNLTPDRFERWEQLTQAWADYIEEHRG
jgi:hypothetical protein